MKQTAALMLGILGLGAIFVQVNDVIKLTFTSKPGSDEGPEITIEGAVLRQEVPIATFKKVGRLCDPWSY